MRSDEDGSGSTRKANEGVRCKGAGEKVAQEGDTEARGANERWMLNRMAFLKHRVSSLWVVVSDLVNLEPRVERLEKSLESRMHPSPIRLYGPEGLGEVLGERPDLARPSCDCPHEMRSDCATCNPCTPAPPPSVEPAEETSSGGERCGEGTAGDAGWLRVAGKLETLARSCHSLAGGAGDCCWRMRKALRVGEVELFSGEWIIHLVSRDTMGMSPVETAPDLNFCPWCATPLREDGELRVGVHPLEGRDTCERGEG